jgi:hypothetical protein
MVVLRFGVTLFKVMHLLNVLEFSRVKGLKVCVICLQRYISCFE